MANDDKNKDGVVTKKEAINGTYVFIHSSGFRDFHLKPEILRALVKCGFEHPSEVQNKCIPQAVLGMDILCQAKSGTGKTAVYMLATLQQIEPVDGQVSVLVMCHSRELALQIRKEYERFSKFVSGVKVGVFFGGLPIAKDELVLKTNCPHIVVGTPGRILALVKTKKLVCKNLKHFILDECDKILEQLDMQRDVQEIFRSSPHETQVMMFSSSLSSDIRNVCKKFMGEKTMDDAYEDVLSCSLNSEDLKLLEEGKQSLDSSQENVKAVEEAKEVKSKKERSPVRAPTNFVEQKVKINMSTFRIEERRGKGSFVNGGRGNGGGSGGCAYEGRGYGRGGGGYRGRGGIGYGRRGVGGRGFCGGYKRGGRGFGGPSHY